MKNRRLGRHFGARLTQGLGMAALLCITSGAVGTATLAQAQTRGGTATLAVEQDIAGFDPLVVGVFDTGQSATAGLIFDTLTRIGDDGKMEPRLAVSWSSTPDFKTWTFKLRPNVKFHDGSPFTAQTVAFNYARMMNPANHCRCAAYLTAIAKVEAVDDLTVVYHMRFPSADLPGILSSSTVGNVVPSTKAIETLGKDYNRHPVGTGPFMLKSWQSGDRLTLERNPNYWNPGHPYLDEVVIRPLPNAQTRFASLQSGEVDIIWHDYAEDIIAARKNPALTVHEYEGSGVYYGMVFNFRQPPLDDIRVRQALRHAMDIDTFNATIQMGLNHQAMDPYGPGSWVKCKDPGTLKYDPDKAKALLQEYGKPVELKIMVTATPRGRTNGQVWQESWKAVGVKATLDEVDQTTLVTKSFKHDFQVGAWRIIDLTDPDIQMTGNFRTGSPVNLAGYSNPEVDKLLDEARSMGDRATRSRAYCKITQILNRELPWIWVLENHYFSISKNNLMGVHKQYSDVVDVGDAWWQK